MALKGKYAHANTLIKILQWLGCMFLFSIIAGGCMFIFPQPFSLSSLKWIQLFQAAAMFLLPPLCMAYLWSTKPLEWLQLSTPTTKDFDSAEKSLSPQGKLGGKLIILAIGIMLVALPAINMLSYLNQQMVLPAFLEPLEAWMKAKEESATQLTEAFMAAHSLGGLIINLLLLAVLPAISEELTFRAVLQKLFTPQRNIASAQHIAIWCSAILFSAIHMQFYGFIPRMLMGALFGYALVWTGSLWIPIIMHLTNNAMAVLLYFTATRAGWDKAILDTIGTNDTLWLGIASLFITIGGIYALRRSTTISRASSRISNGN